MEVMPQQSQLLDFADLPVFKDKRDELDGQDHQITGNAEGHLHQHGVNVGMPKNKPTPHRLTDIDPQHGHGARVAYEPDDDGRINDALEFLTTHNIGQKPGKKGPRPQGDHRQIENDPQCKSKHVAHVGLVQPFPEAQNGRKATPCQQCQPRQGP